MDNGDNDLFNEIIFAAIGAASSSILSYDAQLLTLLLDVAEEDEEEEKKSKKYRNTYAR